MKLAYVAKFGTIPQDEEHVAESFEMLGIEVVRIEEHKSCNHIYGRIKETGCTHVLFSKFSGAAEGLNLIKTLRKDGIVTFSWLFDLFWGISRETLINSLPTFATDTVFTTDGGKHPWRCNHKCVRQGIYKPHCYMEKGDPKGIAFVGGQFSMHEERHRAIDFVKERFPDFTWYGKRDSDEVRGTKLNTLFANTKILVGDSVYSPYYWSNRVVETLGRGGFLIHQEVPGLKEEYPYLVTYKRGDFNDLKEKIEYYLSHEDERMEIVRKNFEWVRDNYTMEKKCKEILSLI